MKSVCRAVRYHAAGYLRTTRYVIPAFVLLAFMGGVYGLKPAKVVDSYAFSMGALFFVMVSVGLTYSDVEDAVSEQVLVLKMGSAVKHHMARALFLLTISVAFGLFTALFPVLADVINRFTLFKRPLTFQDVAGALAVSSAVAFLGGATGAALHPRIIRDRKAAILIAAFVALVGFAKIGIHRAAPALRAVTWAFPPISDILDRFVGAEAFTAQNVLFAAGIALAYGAVLTALQIAVLARRKF